MNRLGLIDSAMLSFVRDAIAQGDTHATELKNRFSFRNRFHHCIRVALLAAEIAELEGADVDVAAVGGLFHDCGKAAGRDHANVSAEICRRYLTENQLHLRKIDRIVDCVQYHSGSTVFSDCSYPDDLVILRDADRLDEVGAMGITWTLLAAGTLEPQSYSDVLNRLMSVHASGKEGTRADQMYTATGRVLMLERVRREQRFVQELSEELGITGLDPDEKAI